MSAGPRLIDPLILRYPLGFTRTGPDAGPIGCAVVLSTNDGTPKIPLVPLRVQPAGALTNSPAEWYLAYDGEVFAKLLLFLANGDRQISPGYPVERGLRLTLGEWKPELLAGGRMRPSFSLTGGSVAVRFVIPGDSYFRNQVAQLWPTHDHRDVDRLYAEPGGVFLGGKLPSSFFAGLATGARMPDGARNVALRLPRSADDAATVDGTPGPGARPFWALTDFPFPGVAATATTHVKDWAGAFRSFSLVDTPDGRGANSIVDSVACGADETCAVGLLGRDGTGAREGISWFARSIHTRISLGGGKAAEASFTPDCLRGRARIGGTNWTTELVTPPRSATPGRPPAVGPGAPVLKFSLTRSDHAAKVDVEGSLQPLVAPAVPIDAPGAGPSNATAGSTVTAADSRGYRLWLCSESGWAAIETPVAEAELDPAQDTEGGILGVIEAAKILAQLNPPPTTSDAGTSLAVDVKARATGSVSLSLAGTAPADAKTPGITASLELIVTDPFLTVATPNVFYHPPDPVVLPGKPRPPLPAVPAITAAAATPPAGTAPTPAPAPASSDPDDDIGVAVSRLEQELAGDRFRQVVFVSKNMVKPPESIPPVPGSAAPPPPPPEPLTVTIDSKGGFRLLIPSPAVAVWQRPAKLPVARTYPLDPDQDLGGFLDANRGLLPFRFRDAAKSVSIGFGSAGLPTLTDNLLTVKPATGAAVVNDAWRLANASGRGGSTAYFLPTLPGVELDLTPALAEPPGAASWVYRHGVPVLDEAYATASEGRRDPTSAANDSGPPTPGSLPPGYDPTRVVGTEAFIFGPALAPEALGWLPRTDSNPRGSLALSGGRATLEGRTPELTFRLTDPASGGTVDTKFSRDDNTSGLSTAIRIAPPAVTDTSLASFKAGLPPAAAPAGTEYDDRLAYGGLPLLAAKLGGRVVTHDALGYRHEEPDPAVPGSARVRGPGAAAPTRRLGLRAVLPPSSIHLEVLGVDLEVPGASASDSPRQTWLLHDGTGLPARLASFPLRPIRLLSIAINGADLVVKILADVCLVDPRRADAPDRLRQLVGVPGVENVTLTWSRPAADADATWKLFDVSGGFDWRFHVPKSNPPLAITRLIAAFKNVSDDDRWEMLVAEVDLATPAGPLTLVGLSSPATLTAGKLTLNGPIDKSLGKIDVHLEPFNLDRTKLSSGLLPDWPVDLGHSLKWRTSGGDFAWTLHRAHGLAGGVDEGWTLDLARGGDVLVHAPLEAEPASPGQLLFRTPPLPPGAPTPAAAPKMPDGSWFERAGGDLVAAGAVFRRADELDRLSAHVLIRLTPRTSIPGLGGELAARLDVEAVMGGAVVPSLSASGWLEMVNDLAFQTPSGPAMHTATLLFRDAPWSLESLFLGAGPDDGGRDIALPVEHALTVGGQTARWQVLQPVRRRTAAAFAQSYLATPPADAQKDRLTFDLGWAWWLRAPGAPEQDAAGTGLAIDSPHLSMRWNFRTRPADRGRFDRERAFVARLPFGFAAPGVLMTGRPITLGTDAAGNRDVTTSGAAGGPTIAPLRRGLDGGGSTSIDAPVYVRGGPDSSWLDPATLAGYFGSDDFFRAHATPGRPVQPLLPAYEDPRGNPTTQLPPAIGDWAWLLAVLSATAPAQDRRLAAASLRTPYVPRAAPAPLAGSALVELPLTFQRTGPVEFRPDPDRVDVQLLGFVGGVLRTVRRAGLDPDDTLPGDDGRAAVAAAWARDAIEAARRDEGALLLRDFGEIDRVPQPFSAARADRPAWPVAPLAPSSGGAGLPPAYEDDARSRPPAAVDAGDRLVTVPPEGTGRDAPDYFVFAARPEIPPPALRARQVAASRVRLAVPGLDKQPGTAPGQLAPARRAVATSAKSTDPGASSTTTILAGGDLFGWTKAEDVPFQVADPTDRTATPWLVFPTPGHGPHARRDPLPRHWAEAETGEVVTIAPPLIDAVVWARRPGELTRSIVGGFRGTYPADGPPGRVFEESVAPGQAVRLRRPRAGAGPYEAVTIEPTRVRQILARRFQYTRLRLTQTLDATPPPDHGELLAVLAAKSDVFPSSTDFAAAAGKPALLHLDDAKAFELHVVDWGTGAGVPASGTRAVLVGLDGGQKLHVRVFDDAGARVADTDESLLPPAKAPAVAALKLKLKGLLPPASISDIARADVIKAATALVDLNLVDGGFQIDRYSLMLVARKDLVTGADYASGVPVFRTVLTLQTTPAVPNPVPASTDKDTPPVVNDPTTSTTGAFDRLVLFDLHFPPTANPAWKPLFDNVVVLDVPAYLKANRPEVAKALDATLGKKGVGTSQVDTLYLIAAVYTRAKDEPTAPWVAPGSPQAVIAVARLKERNELVKPKTSLALLHAPRTNAQPEPTDDQYRLAGFGHLGDDDFQPITAVTVVDADQTTKLVGWARVANLQSLERMGFDTAAFPSPTGPTPDDPAGTVFRYDVVFYGPGGELIPTRPAAPG